MDVEQAVRDLVDDSVTTEGVVDIFAAAGLERVDLSILDDAFLQTFKDRPFPNLRLTYGQMEGATDVRHRLWGAEASLTLHWGRR